MNPKPGDTEVLTEISPGLLDGLPGEDQAAIVEVVGKPVLLWGYVDRRAELEFIDKLGIVHFSYVNPVTIRAAG